MADVRVTDTVTLDNGTTPDAVVCDWANSSDATTPARNLSVGETVTCTASSFAVAGQYRNLADVVGTPVADATTADPDAPVRLTDPTGAPLADVVDEDRSAYFGPNASIDIEKDTNGNQADTVAVQDSYSIGDAINWTFDVTNTGNVDLADVVVTDTVTTDNGTMPDAVVCDWASSSDATTPARNLSVGETVTCTASSTAAAGQYANLADVVGTPVADATAADPDSPVRLTDAAGDDLADAVDDDPSHYFGSAAPSIDIEKDTNGNQADTIADQDGIAVRNPVTWTFVVTNTGDADLADVRVTDTVTTDNGTALDPDGVVCDWANSSNVDTPARNLAVGETVTCTASSSAAAGQYANLADVVATPVADAVTADPDSPVALRGVAGEPLANVTDDDPSHYFGGSVPRIDIEKDTNGNQADTIADQDYIKIGETLTWTFDVVNTGNVDLAGVDVTDTVTTDNGTAVDPAGVVCDWANSSDPATPATNLSVNESVSCTSTSEAVAGQYANMGRVTGTAVTDATLIDPIPLVDPDGTQLAPVSDEDPSHYFGPIFDLALRKQLDDGTNLRDVTTGSIVTFKIEVFNQGNVPASGIEIVEYLPEGVELTDENWTVGADGSITRPLDGVNLMPGESTEVEISVRVTATQPGIELETRSEISSALPVDVDGATLVVTLADGSSEPLPDVDSTPDVTDNEDVVEDEIGNAGGDEDDHDRAGIVVAAAPGRPSPPSSVTVPQPEGPGTITNAPPSPVAPPAAPTPAPPLAVTGSSSRLFALIGSLFVMLGSAFVVGARRMCDDDYGS